MGSSLSHLMFNQLPNFTKSTYEMSLQWTSSPTSLPLLWWRLLSLLIIFLSVVLPKSLPYCAWSDLTEGEIWLLTCLKLLVVPIKRMNNFPRMYLIIYVWKRVLIRWKEGHYLLLEGLSSLGRVSLGMNERQNNKEEKGTSKYWCPCSIKYCTLYTRCCFTPWKIYETFKVRFPPKQALRWRFMSSKCTEEYLWNHLWEMKDKGLSRGRSWTLEAVGTKASADYLRCSRAGMAPNGCSKLRHGD